ncbi:MAG: tRNA (adenosine(37)-N6)-threonylcarbamoyltransferase complex transferase subunit TsaD [Spirochaetales bacterium]|uniref:tRNA N6-adenosine threonylcarbamoyltransferase n=1 Tax=Candidatus Thalassospirochaeta sargassi TaxID=3119039 RepID=A0AAJ1MNW3_9SPIO|nr:tRNA (adenosine(37)-N6)-threonylcarbamoyltransferase complex transferase subunit TsaD [Spirochaetales bacterium]
MLVLGIESSCDECSAAVVEDGRKILSNNIATQIEIHKEYDGVVPEIASRTHTEWVKGVVESALTEAGTDLAKIDGISVTNRPGLIGSLMVGLSYAKGLSLASGIPFIGIDHILAHLYSARLEHDIEYPFIGLIVSGGHTIISVVRDFDHIEVMGTTIDDACGEAYDKVAKHYGFGYPGGLIIDQMAQKGDDRAFSFPDPSLHKGEHRYDVSYSGLKTAVINQIDQFHNEGYEKSEHNIAASFQKAAITMLMKRLFKASSDTGISRVVAGGGVAANSYLRSMLRDKNNLEVYFPSMELCTDNAAMVAGLGYHYLKRGDRSGFDLSAGSRVEGFRKKYP